MEHFDHGLAADEKRDARLMERIRCADEGALDELLRLYWRSLVDYVERMLGRVDAAEDIVQQTFLQLWERRAHWQAGGCLRAYLYRVARNLSLNELRRQQVRRRWRDAFRREKSRAPSTPEQDTAGNELERAIQGALAALPERRREVFQLVRFQNLSYREVGEIMGISPQTVANQMSAALAELRRSLASFIEEPAEAAPPHRAPTNLAR